MSEPSLSEEREPFLALVYVYGTVMKNWLHEVCNIAHASQMTVCNSKALKSTGLILLFSSTICCFKFMTLNRFWRNLVGAWGIWPGDEPLRFGADADPGIIFLTLRDSIYPIIDHQLMQYDLFIHICMDRGHTDGVAVRWKMGLETCNSQ